MTSSTPTSVPNSSKLLERRSRGRPREFDTQETLRRATHVFWKRGYHATSLDDLIEATGVQKSSLYAAFGEKAALFSACLEFYGKMVLKNVLEGSGKESTPAETLNGYLRRAIKFVTQNHTPKGCLIVCVLSELALTEPSGLQRLRRMLAVNERIVSLQLKGVGFEGDCETAAKIASTLVTGFAVRARSGETRASLLKNVSPAAALVMNACGGKAA